MLEPLSAVSQRNVDVSVIKYMAVAKEIWNHFNYNENWSLVHLLQFLFSVFFLLLKPHNYIVLHCS